jgi:hypothetical protein
MSMVRNSSKVSLTTFKKLPMGAIYYLAADGTGPFVKISRTARLATNSKPQTSPSGTAVANTSVSVIQVTKFALGSQNAVV